MGHRQHQIVRLLEHGPDVVICELGLVVVDDDLAALPTAALAGGFGVCVGGGTLRASHCLRMRVVLVHCQATGSSKVQVEGGSPVPRELEGGIVQIGRGTKVGIATASALLVFRVVSEGDVEVVVIFFVLRSGTSRAKRGIGEGALVEEGGRATGLCIILYLYVCMCV